MNPECPDSDTLDRSIAADVLLREAPDEEEEEEEEEDEGNGKKDDDGDPKTTPATRSKSAFLARSTLVGVGFRGP